jgi:hypothetical protein
VENSHEAKFLGINKSGQSREASSKKRRPERYENQDFSIDFDTNDNMFEEFETVEPSSKMHNATNISMSYVKSSIADLSKRLDGANISTIDPDQSRLLFPKQSSFSDLQGQNKLQDIYKQIKMKKLKTKCGISPIGQDSMLPPFNKELLD